VFIKVIYKKYSKNNYLINSFKVGIKDGIRLVWNDGIILGVHDGIKLDYNYGIKLGIKDGIELS
jgi:hypothetical protein